MGSGEAMGRVESRGGHGGRLPRFASRRSPGDLVFDAANVLLMLLFGFSVFYPFWSTLVLSFAGPQSASSLGFRFWNSDWSLNSYAFSFSRYGNVLVAYGNSVLRTVAGTVLGLAFTVAAAYPLSKRELPFRNVMTMFVLITMFFSGGLIPSYMLIRSLGLYDSRLALVLPGLVAGYYVIVTRNFFMTIDKAFEESAFIDGASYPEVIVRIVLPLSKPILATIALWIAVGHWNAWFDALIYIRSEQKVVLQILLRRLYEEMDVFGIGNRMESFMMDEKIDLPTESVKAAIIVLTIGPIIMVYPFLQKHFVKGVFMGSLKG
jgi:putative aldouronate transport system permease protein